MKFNNSVVDVPKSGDYLQGNFIVKKSAFTKNNQSLMKNE